MAKSQALGTHLVNAAKRMSVGYNARRPSLLFAARSETRKSLWLGRIGSQGSRTAPANSFRFQNPWPISPSGLELRIGRSVYTAASTCKLSQPSWVHLESRGVVLVTGTDAISFLQGLTTNDMTKLGKERNATSCAILNAQGRVMFDILVSCKDTETLYIDCVLEKLPELLKVLKKYKLRSKAKLHDVTAEYGVWCAVGPSVSMLTSVNAPEGALIFSDPRHSDLGIRAIVPKSVPADSIENFISNQKQWPQATEDTYEKYRMSMGIPQGPDEIIAGNALPLEVNLELYEGVSFSKGCYVGQELTARTHFRGQVRKRLIPFILTDTTEAHDAEVLIGAQSELATAMAMSEPAVEVGEAVQKDGKQIGKVVAVRGGVGLAMIRLQHMVGKEHDLGGLGIGNRTGAVILPPWWETISEQEKKKDPPLEDEE